MELLANGGEIKDDVIYIKEQSPKAPKRLEVSFPGIKPPYQAGVEDSNWVWKGNWKNVTKEWWKILIAKLRGHYQYYGVSENYDSIARFYKFTIRMVRK